MPLRSGTVAWCGEETHCQNTSKASHLAEAQALALAASINAAAKNLERNGPATPDEVRKVGP